MPYEPHPVNRVEYLFQANDFGSFIVVARTSLSDPPDLFTSCTPFDPAAKTRKVGGGTVPHGNRASYKQPPQQFPPTYSDGLTHMWDIAPPCQPGESCEWFLAELGAPPNINWSTLIHQCNGGPGPGDGYWLDKVDLTAPGPGQEWGISGAGLPSILLLGSGGTATASIGPHAAIGWDFWHVDPSTGFFINVLCPHGQGGGIISNAKTAVAGATGMRWTAGVFTGMAYISCTPL